MAGARERYYHLHLRPQKNVIEGRPTFEVTDRRSEIALSKKHRHNEMVNFSVSANRCRIEPIHGRQAACYRQSNQNLTKTSTMNSRHHR